MIAYARLFIPLANSIYSNMSKSKNTEDSVSQIICALIFKFLVVNCCIFNAKRRNGRRK